MTNNTDIDIETRAIKIVEDNLDSLTRLEHENKNLFIAIDKAWKYLTNGDRDKAIKILHRTLEWKQSENIYDDIDLDVEDKDEIKRGDKVRVIPKKRKFKIGDNIKIKNLGRSIDNHGEILDFGTSTNNQYRVLSYDDYRVYYFNESDLDHPF